MSEFLGAVYQRKATGKYGFVVEGEDFLRTPNWRALNDAELAMP